MKALSIKQPWAWAICNLPDEFKKNIENRTWNTKYRGDFLVHASKGFDKEGYKRVRYILFKSGYDIDLIPKPEEFVKGAIVGSTTLVDCLSKEVKRLYRNEWYDGEYAFMLENSKAFKDPIPYKGQLNFFNVDAGLVRKQMV